MPKKKVIFLMGPTAIGKTRVSLYLAKNICAEIINCDSMQLYKYMDIASSKPSKRTRRQIPHHLFDIISPTTSYSAYKYSLKARKKLEEIIKKDKIPLFVGGSGLYMKAVIDGLFEDTGADLKLRRSLGRFSCDVLFRRLKKLDPQSAKIIHPHNKRRIIRALEVYYKNKKPLSFLKEKTSSIEDKYDIRIFCLDTEREALYKRIDERVNIMFRKGLLAEVKRLSRKKISKTARQALGVRELLDYLKDKISLEQAKRLIKRNSRRYAKRQLTWFRKDRRVRWIKVSFKEKPQVIAKKIKREIC